MKEISLIECQAISAGCDVCGGKNKEAADNATDNMTVAIGTGIVATFAATIGAIWYFAL